MSKVFVLMDSGHDYSAAEEFGNIVMLNLQPSWSYDIPKIFSTLQERMADASADDFILLSGLPTFCCVATSLMTDWFSEVHFLLYSDGKYLRRDMVYNYPFKEHEDM